MSSVTLTIVVSESSEGGAIFSYSESQANLMIGQKIRLYSFSEPGYDDEDAIVATVGAQVFTSGAAFINPATGSADFLSFTTEILEADTDQPFFDKTTQGLTSYGETVLFNLKTAIEEIQTYLRSIDT